MTGKVSIPSASKLELNDKASPAPTRVGRTETVKRHSRYPVLRTLTSNTRCWKILILCEKLYDFGRAEIYKAISTIRMSEVSP